MGRGNLFSRRRIFFALVALSLWVATPVTAQVSYPGIMLYPLSLPSSSSLFGGGSANLANEVAAAGEIVGFGNTEGNAHAVLWSETTGSAVDLNPSGFSALSLKAQTESIRSAGATRSWTHRSPMPSSGPALPILLSI